MARFAIVRFEDDTTQTKLPGNYATLPEAQARHRQLVIESGYEMTVYGQPRFGIINMLYIMAGRGGASKVRF